MVMARTTWLCIWLALTPCQCRFLLYFLCFYNELYPSVPLVLPNDGTASAWMQQGLRPVSHYSTISCLHEEAVYPVPQKKSPEIMKGPGEYHL